MGLFCTLIHKFAQSFPLILIDGQNRCDYRARQIELKSLKTLRLSLEGASASRQSRRQIEPRSLENFTASV
jgi:hypothetical protein